MESTFHTSRSVEPYYTTPGGTRRPGPEAHAEAARRRHPSLLASQAARHARALSEPTAKEENAQPAAFGGAVTAILCERREVEVDSEVEFART